MLNKPKFMSPSVNMYGNSVIDLNSDTLPFSCIVDGNEAITDFRIMVSRLKDGVIVFDTEMQTLEKPFFPINNRNQNVVFSIDLKKYFTSDNSSEFVNSADAYYWSITFKNNISGTETYSASEVFYANSKPDTVIYYSYDNNFIDTSANYVKAKKKYDSGKTYYTYIGGVYAPYKYNESTWDSDRESLYYISFTELNDELILSTDIDNISVLSKRKIYFKSSYSQSEDIALKRYGWRLTDATNNVVVIDTITKNQIYGISDDISCVCNGLVNNTDYLLELYIETQNGYFDILQSIKFNVSYPVKSIDADFDILALNNTSGIMLNWGNLKTTEGVVVGDLVSYVENFPINSTASIEIPDATSVVFEGNSNDKELGINENSYVVLSFQFDKTDNKVLFEMSGSDEYSNDIMRKLEYSALEGELRYTVRKGDIIATCSKPLSDLTGELCWYVATLYPLIDATVDFKLSKNASRDGLFPISEDSIEDELIYPSDELYPHFGEWNEGSDEVV